MKTPAGEVPCITRAGIYIEANCVYVYRCVCVCVSVLHNQTITNEMKLNKSNFKDYLSLSGGVHLFKMVKVFLLFQL